MPNVLVTVVKKPWGALGFKTIKGKKLAYLWIKAGKSYHAFIETAAKTAAQDCGAKGTGDTRKLCQEVWDRTP